MAVLRIAPSSMRRALRPPVLVALTILLGAAVPTLAGPPNGWRKTEEQASVATGVEHRIVLTDAPPYVHPLHLEIAAGDTVVFENEGPEEIHSVTDEAAMLFASDLPVGESFSYTFPRAGVYPFVCFRHHFMKGSITARNADGSIESEPEFPYQRAFTEFAVPTRNAVPRMIIASKVDDSIWFTEGGGGFYGFEDFKPMNKLGQLRPDGSILEVAAPPPAGKDWTEVGVDSLVMDDEGVIYFTERLTNRIGRLGLDGRIEQFQIPTEGGYALGIDLAPDGKVWFAERYGHKIGWMSPSGEEMVQLDLPEGEAEPRTVFVDSKGLVWYTARTANTIGYLDPSAGEITSFPIPTELARPTGIAETSDGAIYFVEMVGNKIARIVDGQITEYPIPTQYSAPFKIVADANDNLWFTQVFGNSIGKLDPRTGRVTEYKIPTPDSRPGGIAVDRRGRIWFTEQTGNKIGTFDPAEAERIARRDPAAPHAEATAEAPIDKPVDKPVDEPVDEPADAPEVVRLGAYHARHVELPDAGSGPGNDLVEGDDGWIWFNQIYGNRVGAIHRATREIRSIELPTPVSMPVALVLDESGRLWVTQFRGNALARVDIATGEVREYPVPTDASLPSGVTLGADGAVWFAQLGANAIARFDPETEAFLEVPLPVDNGSPLMIAADSTGDLWITLSEERGNYLARYRVAARSFELYPLPTKDASPIGLLVEDDAVWIAEGGVGQLARFDLERQTFEEFTIPADDAEPVKLARGADGRIWLTDGGGLAGDGGNRLIAFDPRSELFELVPMDVPAAKPRGILAASDGQIWFSQQNANRISQLLTDEPTQGEPAR